MSKTAFTKEFTRGEKREQSNETVDQTENSSHSNAAIHTNSNKKFRMCAQDTQTVLPALDRHTKYISIQLSNLGNYEFTNFSQSWDLHKELVNCKTTLTRQFDEALEKFTGKMKKKLLERASEHAKNVTRLIRDFKDEAPFAAHITPHEALTQIAHFKCEWSTLYGTEKDLRIGLESAGMNEKPSDELHNFYQELEAVEQIWSFSHQLDRIYRAPMADLESPETIDKVQAQFDKLDAMARDKHKENWEVLFVTMSRITKLKSIIPDVKAFGSKTLRKWHWDKLEPPSKQSQNNENLAKMTQVFETASQQSESQALIDKIKLMLKTVQFDIGSADTGNVTVDQVKMTVAEVDEHIGILRQARLPEPLVVEIDKWKRESSRMLQFTKALLDVQKHLAFLSTLVDGASQDHDAEWRTIIGRIDNDPSAYRVVRLEGLDHQLANLFAKHSALNT